MRQLVFVFGWKYKCTIPTYYFWRDVVMLLEKNYDNRKKLLMNQIFQEMLLFDVVLNSDAWQQWDAHYSLL